MKDTARVLGRTFDGIEYRGSTQENVETLAKHAGVPVWNGLTNEFHPTQILADMLTMTEHTDKHLPDIAFCYLGDARNNMGNSLMVGGCKLGMDVRLCAPERPVARTTTSSKTCREHRRGDRRPAHPHRGRRRGRDAGSTTSTPTCGCRWARTRACGRSGSSCSSRTRSTATSSRAPATRKVRFMHCLPAFHNRETKVGEEIFQKYGMDGLEVTDDVFESENSIVFDQAENRMHTIKAVMVATLGLSGARMRVVVALGGNALLKRGEPMTAELQRRTCGSPRRPWLPSRRSTSWCSPTATVRRSGCWRCRRAAYTDVEAYPLDVLGAADEGMIGYVLEQELGNAAADGRRRSRPS